MCGRWTVDLEGTPTEGDCGANDSAPASKYFTQFTSLNKINIALSHSIVKCTYTYIIVHDESFAFYICMNIAHRRPQRSYKAISTLLSAFLRRRLPLEGDRVCVGSEVVS